MTFVVVLAAPDVSKRSVAIGLWAAIGELAIAILQIAAAWPDNRKQCHGYGEPDRRRQPQRVGSPPIQANSEQKRRELTDVAKYYTEVGFGAITWHGLTINKRRFERLPKEVQDIFVEVGREYEAMTGKVNEENYPKQIAQLKANGAVVKSVPESVRLDWAKSLTEWPQQRASELDKQGLPGSEVLKLTIEEAEKLGYKWPVRYPIK